MNGDLYYGAHKSSQSINNIRHIQNFLTLCKIINIDINIAKMYGIIKEQLQANGKSIPENDIWIAATAKINYFRLITLDAHFKSIQDINIFP